MFQIRLMPIVYLFLILLFAVKLNEAAKHAVYAMVIKDSHATNAETEQPAPAQPAPAQEVINTSKDKDSSHLYVAENDPSKVSTTHANTGTVFQNLRLSDQNTYTTNASVSLSNTEIDILQGLSKRRDELDQREKDISLREDSLKVLQQNIEGKISELNEIQSKVDIILKEYQQKEEEKTSGLVKVYEAMKAQDAARIFDQLDMSILIDVAGRMKESKLAQILSKMDPYRAKELTVELANRRKLKEPNIP